MVRVRQRASGFFLLSSSFRCPSGRRLTAVGVHAASTAWTSTLSASDSAGHDLDRGMDVVCFPRLDIPREGGAVVPLADAVQQVDLDLARAMLHAKARRSSKKLEQVVSELRRINSQTHSRNSSPIGSRRLDADRLHEGTPIHQRVLRPGSRAFNSPLAGGSLTG